MANIKDCVCGAFYILSFNAEDREKMLRKVNMIKKLIQICRNQQNGFRQLSLGQKTLMLYVTGGIVTIPCLRTENMVDQHIRGGGSLVWSSRQDRTVTGESGGVVPDIP